MKSLPWYNLNELGVMHAAWKVSTSCSLFQLFQKLTSWLVLCLAFRAALQNRTFEVRRHTSINKKLGLSCLQCKLDVVIQPEHLVRTLLQLLHLYKMCLYGLCTKKWPLYKQCSNSILTSLLRLSLEFLN